MGDKNAAYFIELRKQAEKILAGHAGEKGKTADADFLHLLYELEIHQVELEIQNEELQRAQKELEASRNEYHDLFDSAPVGFVTLTPKGNVARVNRAAEKLLFSPGEPLSQTVFSSRVYPQDYILFNSCLKKVAGNGGRHACEVRLTQKDGGFLYVRIEASACFNERGDLAEWRLALSDITLQKKSETALRRAHERLKERTTQLARLSSELALTEERERRRLAGILHDHLQQLLIGVKLNLDALPDQFAGNHKQTLETARTLLADSIQQSRAITTELSPPVLYQNNLTAGLAWLSRWMQDRYGFSVELQLEPDIVVDQEDMTIVLFQSVRELLFNALKHSGADFASVSLSRDGPERVRIVVSDAGKGFDAERIYAGSEPYGGLGLFAIRERLQLLGGRFEVKSAPGKGVSSTLIAPVAIAGTAQKPVVSPKVAPLQASDKKSRKIRTVLADDHAVVRQGLAMILNIQPDIEVVGEAKDGEEAVKLAKETEPDVILMDISMPNMNGLEATRIIHSEFPHIRIISLSMFDKDDQAAAMISAGASAYRSKSDHTDRLLAAIRGEAK